MKLLSQALATFFWSGRFPFAPGTFASLIAALLYRFWLFRLSGPLFVVLILIVFILGVAVSGVHAHTVGRKDPREIVLDEVCGQWIALILAAPSWTNILLAFFLFRILDVAKPFPIRHLERLPSGWGIMADDALAGFVAAVLLRIIGLVL